MPTLELTDGKKKTVSCNLSSELHTHAMACAYAHTNKCLKIRNKEIRGSTEKNMKRKRGRKEIKNKEWEERRSEFRAEP